MNLISLFSGCGGLDLGFEKAGFKTIWANEYDREIWATYQQNFPQTQLDTRSIRDIPSHDIPNNLSGVIGGPPCQSWSEAGAQRGIADERGQLFFEYIRVLRDKQPLFFLAENVQGMLFKKNQEALNQILQKFEDQGYIVSYQLLNTVDYDVPQDRKRVIFIGYHKKLGLKFTFPKPSSSKRNLKDAIWDLRNQATPAQEKNYANSQLTIPNHEYMIGGFSSMFMSRNRVRTWDEPSFTIQAGGRHAPIHPQANVMIKIDKDLFEFDPHSSQPYRRLTVRECARVQTFPDDFIFVYNKVSAGYKMVGNAVPVSLATIIAEKIYADLNGLSSNPVPNVHAEYEDAKQLRLFDQ